MQLCCRASWQLVRLSNCRFALVVSACMVLFHFIEPLLTKYSIEEDAIFVTWLKFIKIAILRYVDIADIREVDAWVRRNTIERFGPVHAVKPELVFELAFEGIQRSPRHRSGIAVRFPRMARWRQDKKAVEADTIETIRALIG